MHPSSDRHNQSRPPRYGNSIESRAAAILTVAQLEGMTADVLMGHFMGPWVGMPRLHESVLRAASDLGGKLKDSTKELVAAALNATNQRTQLQAIVALMRIKNPGNEASDKILNAASGAKVTILGRREAPLSAVSKATGALPVIASPSL